MLEPFSTMGEELPALVVEAGWHVNGFSTVVSPGLFTDEFEKIVTTVYCLACGESDKNRVLNQP
jgi:hypothetical protein